MQILHNMKISGDELSCNTSTFRTELLHDKEHMKEIKPIEEFRGNRVREVVDEEVTLF